MSFFGRPFTDAKKLVHKATNNKLVNKVPGAKSIGKSIRNSPGMKLNNQAKPSPIAPSPAAQEQLIPSQPATTEGGGYGVNAVAPPIGETKTEPTGGMQVGPRPQFQAPRMGVGRPAQFSNIPRGSGGGPMGSSAPAGGQGFGGLYGSPEPGMGHFGRSGGMGRPDVMPRGPVDMNQGLGPSPNADVMNNFARAAGPLMEAYNMRRRPQMQEMPMMQG